MENKCPVCGSEDCVSIIKGYESQPIEMLKCTRCGREYAPAVECTDGCKIEVK
jgi:formate dehydrogenase maturation protein FdhE